MTAAGDRLGWEACLNVRDLGGHPTPTGTTRPRAIVRSDSLCRLTSSGRRAVLDYGVRTVVDLRGPSEARAGSRPFPSAVGSRVTYVNTPLYDERDAATMRALLECESAKQTYEVLLSESGPAIAGAAQAVARAPRGAVVVHCQIGRDRTGLLSALLLSLVGVPAPAIIADYALSRPALEPLFGRWLTQARTEQEHRAIERARRCEPDAMQATLDLLDERYAGSVGFLRDAGLEDDDREALVARLSPA